MQIIRIILAGAWLGVCSIAAMGGAYFILHSPAPGWEHFVRLRQFARSTIRLFAQLEQIMQQLERRPDAAQQQEQQQQSD